MNEENFVGGMGHPSKSFLDKMTLRDWFAGMALQGICASMPREIENGWELVKKTYEVADAMIEARKS